MRGAVPLMALVVCLTLVGVAASRRVLESRAAAGLAAEATQARLGGGAARTKLPGLLDVLPAAASAFAFGKGGGLPTNVADLPNLPDLLAAFCNGGGLGYLFGLVDREAWDELAASCPDGRAPAIRALVDSGLDHRDPTVRHDVAATLGDEALLLEARQPTLAADCVAGLRKALDSEEFFMRLYAAEVLGKVAATAGAELAALSIAALAEVASGDEMYMLRISVVEIIGDVAMHGCGGAALARTCLAALAERSLSDGTEAVRMSAVWIIGKIAADTRDLAGKLGAECIATLAGKALSDASSAVRARAAQTLGDVAKSARGERAGLADLCVWALAETALANARGDSRAVRIAAAEALASVAMALAEERRDLSARCISALSERALAQADPLFRVRTVEVLGKTAVDARSAGRVHLADQIAPLLSTAALSDESAFVRGAAELALGQL